MTQSLSFQEDSEKMEDGRWEMENGVVTGRDVLMNQVTISSKYDQTPFIIKGLQTQQLRPVARGTD